MKKLLTIFTSLGILTSSSVVLACSTGSSYLASYGTENGLLQKSFAITSNDLQNTYNSAQKLYEYLDEKITDNSLNSLTSKNTLNDTEYQIKSTCTVIILDQEKTELFNSSNSNDQKPDADDYGNTNDRRYFQVTYSLTINDKEFSSEWASYALINK